MSSWTSCCAPAASRWSFTTTTCARLAGRPERIAALPYRLLRDVRLTPGGAIPTLEEAFAACGPDLLVNVELKVNEVDPRGTAALVDAVASVVRRLAVGPRVLVSSFNPWAVWVWSRRVPEVPVGLLFERDSVLPLRRAWLAPRHSPAGATPRAGAVHAPSAWPAGSGAATW